MKTIGFYVSPGFQMLDLAGPAGAFEAANRELGGRLDPPLPADTHGRLAETADRTRRVASVCVGAFTLAAAGLLDGRRATTHWRYAARLQREYPSVRVEADRIFCRDGNVWTSAGITAGIDLALALVEEDHGFAIAKGVAQHLVVYHRRHGGQSQFAASIDLAPKNDRIAAALGYARDHIAEALTVERLAGRPA
jgi:transcriptional regulator GlxA family with amidase domain